jgi:hypothetical protein
LATIDVEAELAFGGNPEALTRNRAVLVFKIHALQFGLA